MWGKLYQYWIDCRYLDTIPIMICSGEQHRIFKTPRIICIVRHWLWKILWIHQCHIATSGWNRLLYPVLCIEIKVGASPFFTQLINWWYQTPIGCLFATKTNFTTVNQLKIISYNLYHEYDDIQFVVSLWLTFIDFTWMLGIKYWSYNIYVGHSLSQGYLLKTQISIFFHVHTGRFNGSWYLVPGISICY